MSDKTIYQLTELENVSQDDELIIYDVSDTTETPTKKVKVKNFLNNSYSTEEHPTGKKWIDGKPIYRIAYSGVVADIGDNVDTALSSSLNDKNVDKILKLQGFVNFVSNNLIEPMPSMYIRLYYSTRNKIIYINNKLSSSSTNNIITFIVEYTKTTDV